MTIEEFNSFSWGAGQICRFKGESRTVVIVNFDQAILALDNGEEDIDDLDWVRCENVHIPSI